MCSVLVVCLECFNECVQFWLCVWSELMVVFCFGCVFEVME